MRGSFLFLDQTKKQISGREKKEKEKKEKRKKENKGRKKRKERKTKEREKISSWEMKEKGERKEKGESQPCTLRFLVFRRLEVHRPRIKVGLLNESYE